MKTCEYCGQSSATIFGIEVRACRCGAAHWCCRQCWEKRAKVVGEFPDQDYKLGVCPPRKEVPSC